MRLIAPRPGIRLQGTLERRIGFDAHSIERRQTGNETYASGLLAGFESIGVSLSVFTSAGVVAFPHRSQPVSRNPLLRLGAISMHCRRQALELYHASYLLPPMLPCPAVLTVHDISFALHPEWLPPVMAARMRVLVPAAMRRASRIVTVSHAAKREIVERYGVAPDKISVTHLAPRARTQCAIDGPSSAPYLLFVGNAAPRKNLMTILRAVALLRERDLAIPLVIAGNIDRAARAQFRMLRAEAARLRIDRLVRFEGYVPETRLQQLYAGCAALVHPAWHEGFGLTPLEAMAAGVPVIASDIPAIREVTGGAALLIDPAEPEAWAAGISNLLTDTALRNAMRTSGQERARIFSWERCARETLAVYASALEG